MTCITPDLHVPALSVETTGVLGKLEATRRDMRQLPVLSGDGALLAADGGRPGCGSRVRRLDVGIANGRPRSGTDDHRWPGCLPPAQAPHPVRARTSCRRGRDSVPRAGSTAPHRGRLCRARSRKPSPRRPRCSRRSRSRHRTSELQARLPQADSMGGIRARGSRRVLRVRFGSRRFVLEPGASDRRRVDAALPPTLHGGSMSSLATSP